MHRLQDWTSFIATEDNFGNIETNSFATIQQLRVVTQVIEVGRLIDELQVAGIRIKKKKQTHLHKDYKREVKLLTCTLYIHAYSAVVRLQS